jgi:hypothetical protein
MGRILRLGPRVTRCGGNSAYHSLQESDLDHHEADSDQGEIAGAAHDQLPSGLFDRRPQGNNDRSGDQRDRNHNEHGEG